MKLKDKVVLVTASTRGIGLATVKACAKEGALVYMAARDLQRAKIEADKLGAEGCRVKCVYNDATKPETFATMVDEVAQGAGRIDVLVNNFGTSNRQKDLDFANTDPNVFLDTVTPQFTKCVSGKPGGGPVYAEIRRRKHHQHLFYRRTCARHSPSCLWYQ